MFKELFLFLKAGRKDKGSFVAVKIILKVSPNFLVK